MKYEQMVVLYGTIVVEADSKEKAEKEILRELDGMHLYFGLTNELIVGDFERVDNCKKEVKNVSNRR